MSESDDIGDIGNKLWEFTEYQRDFEMINEPIRQLKERIPLYVEMMAAAFFKETGLNANEAELVITYGFDKVTLHFQKRNNGSPESY